MTTSGASRGFASIAVVACAALAAPLDGSFARAEDAAGDGIRVRLQERSSLSGPAGDLRGSFRLDVRGPIDGDAAPASIALHVGDLDLRVPLVPGKAKRRTFKPRRGLAVRVAVSASSWQVLVRGTTSGGDPGVIGNRIRNANYAGTNWTDHFHGLERADVVVDGVEHPLGFAWIGRFAERWKSPGGPCAGGFRTVRASARGVAIEPSETPRTPVIAMLPDLESRRWDGRIRGHVVSAGAPPSKLSYFTSASRQRMVAPSNPQWISFDAVESPDPAVSVLSLPGGTVHQARVDVAVQSPLGPQSVILAADSGSGTPVAFVKSFEAGDIPPPVLLDLGTHVLEQRTSGKVWASGFPVFGELGIGTLREPRSPVPILHQMDAVSLAAGDCTSLAADRDGGLWFWGAMPFTDAGSEGSGGGLRSILAPTRLDVDARIVAVAAGDLLVSLALDEDGGVWSIGDDGRGPKDADGYALAHKRPVRVEGLPPVTAIAVSDDALYYGLDADGVVWEWTDDPQVAPHLVAGLPPIRTISAGMVLLALDGDGAVWAWGENYRGALGDGTTDPSDVPVRVLLPRAATEVGAGIFINVALLADGTVWQWPMAADDYDAETPDDLLPGRVPDLDEVLHVTAGVASAMAVTADGGTWQWDLLDGEFALSGLPTLADRAYRPGFRPTSYFCIDDASDAKRARRSRPTRRAR